MQLKKSILWQKLKAKLYRNSVICVCWLGMQLIANEMLILVNSLKTNYICQNRCTDNSLQCLSVETHNLKLKAATPLTIHKFNL